MIKAKKIALWLTQYADLAIVGWVMYYEAGLRIDDFLWWAVVACQILSKLDYKAEKENYKLHDKNHKNRNPYC